MPLFWEENAKKDIVTRPRDWRWTPKTVAGACAFVGLLDNDGEMLRYAARCALAMAHCDTWFNSPLEGLPGSRWHRRSFPEAAYTAAVLEAWDWAGGVLTERGRYLLAHTLAARALGWIQADAWEYEYMHHMNQGPVVFGPWLIALVALRQVWPRAGDLIPIVERYFTDALKRYILPDGGSDEGPAYTFWTMHTLIALWVLARDRGEPYPEYARRVLPPGVFCMTDYLQAVRTSDPAALPGAWLPIGDCGRGSVGADSALMLALASGDRLWEAIFAKALPRGGGNSAFSLGLPLLLALGPEQPAAEPPPLPSFVLLPNTGQVMSCRRAEFGPVRFQLIGNKAKASHAHEDRGSFILEAAGEELAIDRGMGAYSDVRHGRLKDALQHNVLAPVLPGGVEPRQDNCCPEAIIPEGSGNETAFNTRIDVTAAWRGLFKKHVRIVTSDRPDRFSIVDEAILPEQGAVAFHLHSRRRIVPLAGDGAGWEIAGERVVLRIRPLWRPAEVRIAEDGIEATGVPVYHLCLISAPGLQHRLETELGVMSHAAKNP